MEDSIKPVKVKVRKYPADKRNFLDVYFSNLVEMGFPKPYPQTSLQAAPHLVPKNSKSKYRSTIDLRAANEETNGEP